MNTLIRPQRRLLPRLICGRSSTAAAIMARSQGKFSTATTHRSLQLTLRYRHHDGTSGGAHSYKRFGGALTHPTSSLQLQKYAPVISNAFGNEPYRSPKLYSYTSMRQFRLSQRLLDSPPSSKVEASVKTMKNKQKEKVEEIMKEAATAATADVQKPKTDIAADAAARKDTTVKTAASSVVVKKPLKTRIWEEILHYYHGFRLLFIDINICRKLLWRVLNGNTLTRRENKLLVRTTSDLFRLIPFSVFIIVPFMELLLPVFIKLFPGMLPSTFQTAKEREDKLKQSLQVRLEMAKFLQKTLDEMALQHKEHKSEEAKQFAEFFQKIKDPNLYVPAEDIIKFAKRFEDEITLDSLSREQLAALCRVLELNTMGTSTFLRFQLRVKLRSLAADDRVIAREGVNSLDLFELQQACKARGMRAYGLTSDRLREQLQEWIDLSLNERVPPTLLLLSRAMLASDDVSTTEKLKETMRVLPDALASKTKAAIGEKEGKIDNKTQIEVIKEEERKIKEEREEERKEETAKQADILADRAPTLGAADVVAKDTAPILTDPFAQAQALADKDAAAAAAPSGINVQPSDEKSISSKDVELLSEALKTLSSEKRDLVVEKETIKDLKEELQEYKEDVEELREVRAVVKEPLHESRAAKLLFKKVNRMIGQLDQVLETLESRHEDLAAKKEARAAALEGAASKAGAASELTPDELALKRKEQELVRIDELVSTIKKLKSTSDESRLKYIERVLSKIDKDRDGVITVDEVLKVVEAIGRDNVQLSEKQLEELIILLSKEQIIEAEEKIERALAKSIKEAKINETKRREQIEKAMQAAKAAEEANLKDSAPVLKDNATDLNLNEEKLILKEQKKTPLATSVNTSLLDATPADQKEKTIPKAEIPSTMPPTIPPTIPPPPTTSAQVNPKDKML